MLSLLYLPSHLRNAHGKATHRGTLRHFLGGSWPFLGRSWPFRCGLLFLLVLGALVGPPVARRRLLGRSCLFHSSLLLLLAVGALLGPFWVRCPVFGRGLLLFGASWGASGLRQASGSVFRTILESFGSQKPRFLKHVSARRGGCFWTCFSCSLSCAGALKFVLFAIGATRAPKQIHRTNNGFS